MSPDGSNNSQEEDIIMDYGLVQTVKKRQYCKGYECEQQKTKNVFVFCDWSHNFCLHFYQTNKVQRSSSTLLPRFSTFTAATNP